MKARFHLPTVFDLRPFATAATVVERDDRRADSEPFSTEAVVVLAVVGGISDQAVKGNVQGRLRHGLGKLRRIVAGSSTDHRGSKQMAAGVTYDGHLGPASASEAFVAPALNLIGTGVSALRTAGVDGPFRALIDQADGAGVVENGSQELLESPFFSRRFWA